MSKFDEFDDKIIVYDPKLAAKLNKILKSYDNGKYVFLEGEEPLFRVPPNLIDSIRERFLGPNAD